jgi:hypothetical protein
MDKAEVIVAVGPHGIACEYIDVLAKLFLIHLIKEDKQQLFL